MVDQPALVLDTFALLVYLRDEPAASRIQGILSDAEKGRRSLFVSIISLGEMLCITERRGGASKAQEALALVQQLPIHIVPADERAVFEAAHIKANHALSYADAFVVAAAMLKNAVILTGDPEFQSVSKLAAIEWLKA